MLHRVVSQEQVNVPEVIIIFIIKATMMEAVSTSRTQVNLRSSQYKMCNT
jgi:hypothetical protein